MARTLWRSLILFSLLFSCEASDSVTFEVFEELEPGTFVGDISNSTTVKALNANENFKQFILSFQFLVNQVAFRINASTGIIRTKTKLDREDLSLVDDTFQTQVRVSKGFGIVNMPIAIKVLDINDNSPYFQETVQNIEILESAPLGAELEVTVAEDKDIGSNTVQSYKIISGNEQGDFKLKVSRPTSELTKVKLVVAKKLDREKNDSYYLVIEARDAGNPSRFATKGLNITVLDSNDHIPKFSKDLFTGEIRENSPNGTFVLQVNASDKDLGTNAEIVFSLKSRRPQYENLFTLDAQTGELRTNAVLDYELSKVYQLEVTAKDKGPDSIPSSAAVRVQVLDENDNSPEITVTNFSEAFDGKGRLPEDTLLKTGLAMVTVNDRDSGQNGRVTVTLQRHKQDFDLAVMFPGTYILEVKNPLSLDRHKQYKIKIVAEDQGSPTSRRNSRVFVVKLADSNRNAPVFSQDVYNLEVRDDVTVSEVVTMVTATDEDQGRNAELTYVIESLSIGKLNATEEDKSKWFSIDPTTGQVRVVSELWCAFTPSFRLQIDVKDKGRVPFHGKTTLNISVRCSKHLFNFSVAENEPEGTEVGKIPFSNVIPERPLQIRLLSDGNQEFAIDEKTGVLTTKRLLDREDVSSYLLTAVLSDGSAEMKLAVNIKIVDENDNTPVFIGLRDHDNITLTKPVFIGETILKVQAVDEDSGSNGQVQYSIVGGNDNQVFRINTRNGRITLRKQLIKTLYKLTIKASDSGVIEEESFLRLSISVKFITPAPPSSPPTTKNVGVVDSRKGGFFEDTKMIIIIAVAAGVLLLTVFLTAVFCIRHRRKGEKKPDEVGNRGSYHEPDISREDALMASKKMFHQATAKQRQSPSTRQKTVNVSPYPIKKMHSMPYQAAGTGSPTGPVKPDMYYPVEQEAIEYGSSDDELDSGRGGSSRSSPYCTHSPPSKKKENWSHPHVRYNAPAPYRARGPALPPSPPPYEEVQRRPAFVTISGITHSTTDL